MDSINPAADCRSAFFASRLASGVFLVQPVSSRPPPPTTESRRIFLRKDEPLRRLSRAVAITLELASTNLQLLSYFDFSSGRLFANSLVSFASFLIKADERVATEQLRAFCISIRSSWGILFGKNLASCDSRLISIHDENRKLAFGFSCNQQRTANVCDLGGLIGGVLACDISRSPWTADVRC